ncbi:MAG: FAD-dependent oxidoreductase [Actinomycetota bacterium]
MRTVVIGAGPAGLGAARRLAEAGETDWAVYEAHGYVGGMSASHVDEAGFLWDEGGHVLFSRYRYVDAVIDEAMGDDFLPYERSAWIYLLNSWVPYPFQNNLRHLPKEALLDCLEGLTELAVRREKSVKTFKDWLLANFGSGICEYFLFRHNGKLWTVPLDEVGAYWTGESVSAINVRHVLSDVIFGRDDTGFGANKYFKYPLHGGTGEIWRRVAAPFADKVAVNKRIQSIDLDKKEISFADGGGDAYDNLISTMPLTKLLEACGVTDKAVKSAAGELKSTNVLVVGAGLRDEEKNSRAWVYYPEETAPFYRCTHLSNYSPYTVPDGDAEKYKSYMFEVAYRPGETVDREAAFEGCLAAIKAAGVVGPDCRDHLVSRYYNDVPDAYPIPTLRREEALDVILPYLNSRGVFSSGRMGAWKYELASMDQAFMQGVHTIEELLGQSLSG